MSTSEFSILEFTIIDRDLFGRRFIFSNSAESVSRIDRIIERYLSSLSTSSSHVIVSTESIFSNRV